MDSEYSPAQAPPDGVGRAARRAEAFVVDPETRSALKECLADWDLDAHPGNIRTAVAALTRSPSPQLILVDLDGVNYPSGSIYELASVCEVGTAVIALGSQDSARFGRSILTTGVADYLIKPVTPSRLHEVVARALSAESGANWLGRAAGFVGTGGSGATTLLAATAVAAANRGHYVSVLDLHRGFSALPFLLDIEPALGLDELLEAAGHGPLDPTLVDGVRVAQSDRISVYGHRWNPVLPPAASLDSVRRLLAELRRRSHLVLVDPDPKTRVATLGECDTQVLVTEPTASGALRAARAFAILGSRRPTVLVQNHTRALRRSGVVRSLRSAKMAAEPDIRFPFDPTLPELSDWGQLAGQLPKKLHKPLNRLTDLLVAASGSDIVDPAPELRAAA